MESNALGNQNVLDMRSSLSTAGDVSQPNTSSTGSAVFPGFQNYTSLYSFQEDTEPVNLSNNNSMPNYDAHQITSSSQNVQLPNSFSTHSRSSPSHTLHQEVPKRSSQLSSSKPAQNIKLPIPPLHGSQHSPINKRKTKSYPALLPLPPPLKQQQPPPLLQQNAALLQQHTPLLQQHPPLLQQHPPLLQQHPPLLQQHPPLLQQHPPLLQQHPPLLQQHLPLQKQSSSAAIHGNRSTYSPSHTVTSSPAIQAALNQPVIGRDRALKHAEVISKVGNVIAAKSHSPFQQAHTMMHFLNQPPLQSGPAVRTSNKTHKPSRRKSQNKQEKSKTGDKFMSVKSSKFKAKVPEDRFVMASEIAGTPLTVAYSQSGISAISDQFAPVCSPRSTMMLSQSGSAENSQLTSEASNDAFKDIPGALSFNVDKDKFAPVDLRRIGGDEFAPVQTIIDVPTGPRSLLQQRLYKKQKRQSAQVVHTDVQRPQQLLCHPNGSSAMLPQGLQQLYLQQLNNTQMSQPSYTNSSKSSYPPLQIGQSKPVAAQPVQLLMKAAPPQASTANNNAPQFHWTSYLQLVKAPAAPHSAFKHVEASLVNGFNVGMKVETPLRTVDTDKYWLATIVSVFGPILKLRFDGHGDKSKDFTMLSTSGQIHPIGWCAKTHRALLPPADIRHTQKQWKDFLMNALHGAKTVPPYLLSARGGPWIADRIRQGMRLEVLHEKLPTAVWVAKVIRSVGGRMKLRYEGSIDDATDFWLFYLDRRVRPCGWAVEPQNSSIIYRPPDEIRATYEYEAWSEILRKVTRDQTIERIPAEIICVPNPRESSPHTFAVGQVLETVHPSCGYICPAIVLSMVADSDYVIVEILDNDNPTMKAAGSDNPRVAVAKNDNPNAEMLESEMPRLTKCCHILDFTLLPVGWCKENGVILGKPQAQNVEEFQWVNYMKNTNAQAATDASLLNQRLPIHQFTVNQRLEAVNPANTDQICAANITKIVGRLLWIEIFTSPTTNTTIITDIASHTIFPAGWCESNNYPLVAPLIDNPKSSAHKSSNHFSQLNGEMAPKIYFNHTCFSGPFLSKGRILELPGFIGPGRVKAMVKEMLNLLISVGYKSSYILKTLQRTDSPNPKLHPQIIKTHCKGKTYEGVIEICTKGEELSAFCKQICNRLKCCPNLVSNRKIRGQCSENCHTKTKTQFLYMESRKPGRPSSTNPDGSKKRKRKRRKKVFTPKRNLYIPKYEYPGAGSDNGSGSSNSLEDDLSPSIEDKPLPSLASLPSPLRSIKNSPTPTKMSKAVEDTDADRDGNNPLFQLELTSVKKLNLNNTAPVLQTNPGEPENPHQYQIVKFKKKRGRPSKQQSPEARQVTLSPSKRYPTVPPLKIRRLEMSPSSTPTPQVLAESSLNNSMNGTLEYSPASQQSATDPTPPPPLLTLAPNTKSDKSILVNVKMAESKKISPIAIKTDPSDNKSDLLLRTIAPRTVSNSALTFTRARLRIEPKDKVVLVDNPQHWNSGKVQTFIQETDCANLASKLNEHEIDGRAFLLLVLPTVQEELGLKLGPALKLCHHVQRLKLAYYEKFCPEYCNGQTC